MLLKRKVLTMGENNQLLRRPVANFIKLFCSSKCVSELLFHALKTSRLYKTKRFSKTNNRVGVFHLAHPGIASETA